MIRWGFAMLLVLGAQLALAAVPSPEDPATVAAWFAQVLRNGDPTEIERALEPGAMRRGWREVATLFGRYECLVAEAVDSTTTWRSPDLAHVRIRLRGVGIARADWHPRFDLPDRWQLEMHRQPDGTWRLRTAMTEARVDALCMIAETSPARAERILHAADDPLLVISNYTIEAVDADQLRRSEPLLQHALALARESGSASAEVDALRDHAVFLAFHKKPGALEIAREAVDVARARGDSTDLAGAVFRVGSVHMLQQQFAEALPHFHESASMIRESTDPVTSLKALRMYAWVLEKLGRYFEDLRALEQLLTLSRHYGWREGEAVAGFGKADVLYALGHLEPALAAWREAAALSRAAGNAEHAAMAYHNIAIILAQRHKFEPALAAAQKAVELCPPDSSSRINMQIAMAVLLSVDDVRAAEQALLGARDTLRVVNHEEANYPGLAIAESRILRSAGKLEEALAAARSVVDRMQSQGGTDPRLAAAVMDEGRALHALGRRAEAIETYHSAIDIIEAERRHAPGLQGKISLFERQIAPYVLFVELLAEQEDDVPAALRIAERMKARTLLEASARTGDDLSVHLTGDERQREKTLELRVTEGNRALLRRTDSREKREKEVAALNAARLELAGFRSDMRLRHPEIAQRDIAIPENLRLPDSDAVEFVVGEQQILAFVVPSAATKSTIRAIAIPIKRSELTARIERYLRALSSRSFGYRSEARALYDTLIAPLTPFLHEGPLTIIPDGPLWSLPFQTLIAPSGAHLAEMRPIAFAPSLGMLHMERPQREARGLLAFGNPRVEGTARETVRLAAGDVPIGPLPEAEKEVRAISGMYPLGTVRIGEEATESAFKREAASYRILHVATHGFVAAGAPLYSGLIFSADAANDGILEAREVADMKLGADLAVLSACDTGTGGISEGEGVVGLSWAFMAAGCPTTVVSQWKADSAATTRLMIEFHRQITRQHSPAEALRRAQKSLIRSEEYWHPYYWAPFMVVGRNTLTP